ncbi:MAG: hypothetical protein EOO02_06460 [Chitinophagaceae bacterium]|nr:MAG: hypothetical protein EOO02_06460 [Chitinophagaceae bacterium]
MTSSQNVISGNADRTDVVIYLRKDGTFTDRLRDTDWKNTVRGKYTVSGSTIKLVYNEKNRIEEYTLNAKGNLTQDSIEFVKFASGNLVPEGTYRFRISGSSRGSGQHYVGSSSGNTYYFDGKNKFTLVDKSGTANKARSTGGGSGKYTLEDGMLTLSFLNGQTRTHSFFAKKDPSTNKIVAAIDGRLFFSDSLVASTADTTNAAFTDSMQNTIIPTASRIYESLRTTYGGGTIDSIQTIYSEATSIGLQIRSFTDLLQNRSRHEIYQDKKLIAVEQLNGESGWQWMKGKVSVLEPERVEELIYTRYIGIPGLQNSRKEHFLSGSVEAASHGFNITFKVNDQQIIYIVDKKLQLLGDAYRIGQTEQANEYRNFKKTSGITFPFIEENYREDQKNVVTYSKIVINEPLKTDWEKP